MFHDRIEAVPMAKRIAALLGGDLDIVLTHKLRAPYQPELAIGAVDETGWTYVDEEAASVGADADYIARETAEQLATLRARRASYTPSRPPRNAQGRVVIVVDDGLATGATMIAALHALRAHQPRRLICAVPVAPPDTLQKVAKYADEVVCLEAPEFFGAVSRFYRRFPQVDDDEVIAALR
jgi:putative phosphoribosyl transferase